MGMQNPFRGQTPFLDMLEAEPRSAFFSFQNQFGQSPNQRRYFQNQFQDIHNQFLGQLGTQIRGGELPTLSPEQHAQRFTSFLENFPFTERFAALPPQQRGVFPSQFNPRTRFLLGF